ncbi:hypothetical protein MBLNU457_4895t1 [Dothideomycetes sp. NU457]
MASHASSSQTLLAESDNAPTSSIDLGILPPIYVSPTHFDLDDLHQFEEKLAEHNAVLTYDINEAKIVLTKVERKKRAQFDLQSKGLSTEEVQPEASASTSQHDSSLPTKRQKVENHAAKANGKPQVIEDESTDSETEDEADHRPEKPNGDDDVGGAEAESRDSLETKRTQAMLQRLESATVKVLKVAWLDACMEDSKLHPVEEYLIYEGRIVEKPANDMPAPSSTNLKRPRATFGIKAPAQTQAQAILERAKADAPAQQVTYSASRPHGARHFNDAGHQSTHSQPAHLIQRTTSEYDSGASSDLPEPPAWVKAGIKYACQRPTPNANPNHAFIELLKDIRTARLLTNDEIGVRAYSTSIAAIAAYPYALTQPREILQLPGCDVKIANLFVEYANTGQIKAAIDAAENPDLKILRLFYDIWGVGATTAREFYYDRGWRELDDIVEYGWSTLSRVQQIGVKYYEEFLSPIPRSEVESIAAIIHRHAVKVRDSGIQSVVVGGYRRGKDKCGDVDIVLSHPDEAQTLNIVTDIVASLEEEGWITHTLLLALTTTHRGQQTLPFRASSSTDRPGFDSLDKALVVWQDPEWEGKTADLARDPKAKNPNIHRRVDIIIAPWRTVGCAVAGWSGGTTFQRDLRRYAKSVKGWKFDSSGVRDRGTGHVIDVEGYHTKDRAKTMVEAERRVFDGFGLKYFEPWERCTG